MRGHAPGRLPDQTVIDVRLRASWVRGVGYRYDAILDGEVIVHQSRDPAYDAARALKARGLKGTFRTIDFVTGRPRMILDIEKAAGLRTVERDRDGLSIEPYQPMTTDDRTRLRPPSLHQGRPSPDGMANRTGQPVAAAGGETAGALSPILEEA